MRQLNNQDLILDKHYKLKIMEPAFQRNFKPKILKLLMKLQNSEWLEKKRKKFKNKLKNKKKQLDNFILTNSKLKQGKLKIYMELNNYSISNLFLKF